MAPRALLRVGLLSAGVFFCACEFNNPGVTPPVAELNFPVALALSPAEGDAKPATLYVVNSDFDLRYNVGSVQSYDLNALEAAVTPDGACELETRPLMRSEVRVGSFASGLALSPDGSRLYVPVRSRPNLTFIESDEGRLHCGAVPGEVHECSRAYRRSSEVLSDGTKLDMPPDPVAVRAGSVREDFGGTTDDRYALLLHRGGIASLFLDAERGDGSGPRLTNVLSALPANLAGIAFQKPLNVAWVTSESESTVALVGVALDDGSPGGQGPMLYDAGRLPLTGLDFGVRGHADVRVVRFDPRPEVRRAYLLARTPEALFVVDLSRTTASHVEVTKVIDVDTGPSRLELAMIDGRLLAFVSSFDARSLYVLDPELGQVLSVVRGLSGPFELAVDRARGWLYVADFRASTIRIIDLAPLRRCMAGEVQGDCTPLVRCSLGRPRTAEGLR